MVKSSTDQCMQPVYMPVRVRVRPRARMWIFHKNRVSYTVLCARNIMCLCIRCII